MPRSRPAPTARRTHGRAVESLRAPAARLATIRNSMARPRPVPLRVARPLAASLAIFACTASAAPAAAESIPAPAQTNPAAVPNPWRLGDDISARLKDRWSEARGVYMNEKGFPDTRLNSLLLNLHSMAALAGHNGPARMDARIEPLVKTLTAPPVLVARSLRARETGHFPHAPAWTPQIGENPEVAMLHPSIDTSVVRSLTAAWRARDVIGMAPETSARIAAVLVELARSPFYRAPSRALNQINWHAEVYSAALEVAGETSVLADYREQLMWFSKFADKADPEYKGGSPNLTTGGGFRYLPNRARTAQLNQVETTEYGNLALSALGFYNAALRAGMQPLPAADVQKLQRWSRHMLLGSWTHSGYPNWDTGLGTRRRHLRQYWAWSLDGLMAASGPDALLGYPEQRSFARRIAERGIALYLQTAWSPSMATVGTPLPTKTSFGAPNGFTVGSGNELIGPLRFALLDASLDGRFQEVGAKQPPNWFASDSETGRTAFSTSRFNGAIVPSRGGQSQGGIEPVRLFDANQRPLTALGGRGTGSLGVAVIRDGSTRLDSQPSSPTRQRTSDIRPDGESANTARSFGGSVDFLGNASSSAGRISIRHRLSASGIRTRYRISSLAAGSKVEVRIPVWGKTGRIKIDAGAVREGGRWKRTSRPLKLELVTPAGARAQVSLGDLPKSASIRISELRVSDYQPQGGQQLTVSFKRPKSGNAVLTRQITVLAPR